MPLRTAGPVAALAALLALLAWAPSAGATVRSPHLGRLLDRLHLGEHTFVN